MIVATVNPTLIIERSPQPKLVIIQNLDAANQVRVSRNKSDLQNSQNGIVIGPAMIRDLLFCNGPVFAIADVAQVDLRVEAWPIEMFSEAMLQLFFERQQA